MRKVLSYLRHQPIALLALFLAIGGGTAYASHLTVRSTDIVNGQVKTPDLGGSAVKTGKIFDGTVKGVDVADGSLTGTDVQDGSLAGTDVQDGSLAGADVQANSLTANAIGPDAVGSSELGPSVVSGDELETFHTHLGNTVNATDSTALDGDWVQGANSTASCTSGEQLVGYYIDWTTFGDENATREIVPNFSSNSVVAQGVTDNGTTESYRAVAVCVFP